MKALRKSLLLLLVVFFSASVLGQGFGGADLTVEESLTEFITNILGFPVDSAADVILYFLGPIIAFYLLISNFAREGYNNFQKRLERRPYYSSDDDLPVGMKLFSLVTSFITVVTIGQLSTGLILILSAIALLLSVLMFLQLISFDNNGNNGNNGHAQQEGQQQQNQAQGETQQQQQGQNQNNTGQQPQNQGNNVNSISAALGSLAGAGQNFWQVYQQSQQQSSSNQIEESLRYFNNDMIFEINQVRTKQGYIEQLIQSIENEMGSSNFNPNIFKKTIDRAKSLESLLNKVRSEMAADFNRNNNPDYNGSNLKSLNSSNPGRDILKEIKGLEGQLERILKGTSSSPPNDKFNDLLDFLHLVVAIGHFIHRSPFTMSEISNSQVKAQKIVDNAEQMNKIASRPDNASQLQTLAGWLQNRSDDVGSLIDAAKNVCEDELKISQAEFEEIEKFVARDEKIHNKLKYIERNIANYRNIPSGFKDNMRDAESVMSSVDSMLASLESKVSAQQDHRSKLYKKLEELEGEI